MRRTAPAHHPLIYLLCSFLLLAQVTGAHLHICLDGQEPPVQLHMAGTSEQHDESQLSLPHSDREIVLTRASSTSGKLFQFDLPPALGGICIPDLQPACFAVTAPGFGQAPLFATFHGLLPPARGPPLLFS